LLIARGKDGMSGSMPPGHRAISHLKFWWIFNGVFRSPDRTCLMESGSEDYNSDSPWLSFTKAVHPRDAGCRVRLLDPRGVSYFTFDRYGIR